MAAYLRHAGRGVNSEVHLLLQLEQRDIIQLGVGVEVLMDDDRGNALWAWMVVFSKSVVLTLRR